MGADGAERVVHRLSVTPLVDGDGMLANAVAQRQEVRDGFGVRLDE